MALMDNRDIPVDVAPTLSTMTLLALRYAICMKEPYLKAWELRRRIWAVCGMI